MTIELTREFRFYWTERALPDRTDNSWSGWGTSLGLNPYLALTLTVAGNVDQPAGFLCNIRDLDRALKSAVNQVANSGAPSVSHDSLGEFLTQICSRIEAHLPSKLRWRELKIASSPFLSIACHNEASPMLILTQQFEFSAAHRLHCPDLTEDENRELFGKCNNPAGHGHNYVVEVSLVVPPNEFSLDQIQATVKEQIIDRFDHKNLDLDLLEFRTMNSSVENIAQVIFHRLRDQFQNCKLHRVRVYETPKTWADCYASVMTRQD